MLWFVGKVIYSKVIFLKFINYWVGVFVQENNDEDFDVKYISLED